MNWRSNNWLICILMNFANSHTTLSLYILVIIQTSMFYLPLLALRKEEINEVEVCGSGMRIGKIWGWQRERVRQVRRGQCWKGGPGRGVREVRRVEE